MVKPPESLKFGLGVLRTDTTTDDAVDADIRSAAGSCVVCSDVPTEQSDGVWGFGAPWLGGFGN